MSQNTEAELERFRQQWREEVIARTRNKHEDGIQSIKLQPRGKEDQNHHHQQHQYQTPKPTDEESEARADRPPSSKNDSKVVEHPVQPTNAVRSNKASRQQQGDALASDGFGDDDVLEPHTFDEDAGRGKGRKRLSGKGHDDGVAVVDGSVKSAGYAHSALEHYERAVEKESLGSLGESVDLYRKAFKLDDGVHETYKNKYFPPPPFTASSESATAKPVTVDAKPAQPNPSNASETVPNTAHHSLHGLSSSVSELLCGFARLSIEGASAHGDDKISLQPLSTSKSVNAATQTTSTATTNTAAAAASRKQKLPCPIATLPEELLAEILIHVAVQDVGSLARLALVCKRLAYVIMTEERVWKRVALGHEYGFAAMRYRYACDIYGSPLRYDFGDDVSSRGGGHLLSISDGKEDISSLGAAVGSASKQKFDPATYFTLSPNYPTYRHMFRLRPRIRFGGLYISTVNYSRPGAPSTSQLTWNSPVLIVTYYRYLRFYRDGTVISLLTTTDPSEVVPVFHRENIPSNQRHSRHKSQSHQQQQHHHYPNSHRSLNSQSSISTSASKPASTSTIAAAPAHPPAPIMKDALRGRWHLSGFRHIFDQTDQIDQTDAHLQHTDDAETQEGILYVETEGVVPKYTWNMRFAMASAGRAARNNKLAWIDFRCYNRLADDWGEFGLKNDRPFYWSRVRSYGTGL